MWKDLDMREKAALIKVAVANGIITLPEIRQAYNKFAQGGDLNDDDDLTKLGGFTSPTLNVELKQQEDTGEIVAQKPQISAPSENVVNVNNRNTDTETAFRNYLDSPIIKTRLAKQYGSDQVDTKLQEMKDRFNKTSIIEGNFGSSYNNKGNIYIDTNATTPWMSNKFAKPITLSHELAHTMYPSNDFDVGKSATYLNKIIPTEEGAKNIYRTEDVGKITDSYNDSTLGHDKQDYEKAAMVYEVREHMRKLGLWDYTSGQKLTPDIWQKYNSIYKRNRLGNYTNDENAVDSLNNLALNTSPEMEEVNYAANGGPINPYSAGSLVDTIHGNSKKEEYLGEPSHHYDFTISEEEADRLGYYPNERGHRDDRVKKPSHPTHPSRGKWNSSEEFELTDKGMNDPNYTLFGLNDGGQDPQAVMTYKGGIVLPEITVTSDGKKYIYNSYDNINIYANGGYKPSSSIKKEYLIGKVTQ